MTRFASRPLAIFGAALVVSLAAADAADARRGGSFGSRGARTYQAPPRTQTAPQQTAPIQRSMTPQDRTAQATAPNAAAARTQAPARRGFGGFGAGILGGLVAGGLIGMLLGNGWGGFGAGFMNTLLQLALIAGVLWLAFRLFRRRQAAAAPAGAYGANFDSQGLAGRGFEAYRPQASTYTPATPAGGSPVEIPITQGDRDTFERLLREVQEAFGREDYAALRERTTPEIMSYLAEELSQNATQGRRNEVTGVRLLEADLAEAWREADADYATCALRYESVDVMRDRTSGALLSGEPSPTETTELWTFVRRAGEPWKLSAIQEA